jgi:hypothetical protein
MDSQGGVEVIFSLGGGSRPRVEIGDLAGQEGKGRR